MGIAPRMFAGMNGACGKGMVAGITHDVLQREKSGKAILPRLVGAGCFIASDRQQYQGKQHTPEQHPGPKDELGDGGGFDIFLDGA